MAFPASQKRYKPCNRKYYLYFQLNVLIVVYSLYELVKGPVGMYIIYIPMFVLFLLMAALFAQTIWSNSYDIIVSEQGIRYQPFRNVVGLESLGWDEIESLESVSLKRNNFIFIKLKDRKKTSWLTKAENLSYDLKIPLNNFSSEAVALEQNILDIYNERVKGDS